MLSGVKSWWSPAASDGGDNKASSGLPNDPTDGVPSKEAPQPAAAIKNEVGSAHHKEHPGQDTSAGVSKEVLDTAKDWGAYIYTFGKRATTSVTSKAKKLAAAPNIVEDFDRQQKQFVNAQVERRARAEAAVPPWVGYDNEAQLREQILALSRDTRNFMRSPPQGANFAFDMESNSPVALATLEVDKNLRKMRFELVPKKVKEEEFWRNYFYRVSLIRQSTQLSALARSNAASAAGSATGPAAGVAVSAAADSASTSSDTGYEKVSPPPSASAASGNQQASKSPGSSNAGGGSPVDVGAEVGDDPDCGDFASTELANQQPAALSTVERQRIGGGGGGGGVASAEDWEAELQRELKEFEVVGGSNTSPPSAAAATADATAGKAPGDALAVDDELEREILEQLAGEN